MHQFVTPQRLYVFNILLCLKVWVGVICGMYITESPVVRIIIIPLYLVTLWLCLRGLPKRSIYSLILPVPYGVSLGLLEMMHRPGIRHSSFHGLFLFCSLLLLITYCLGLWVASSPSVTVVQNHDEL